MTPRSTYRLQLHAGFRFTDATALIPYLAKLGISHVYASPYLKARAGSTHGYDIVDHGALNPEIGTPEDYDAFIDTLRAHGMGHILDFVPNHMGVGGDDNSWWLDVLTWGPASHYAEYFDIDWQPLRTQLENKLLLPFLGRQYGDVLEAGELRWTYDRGTFALRYFEHLFPLSPPTYALVLGDASPTSLASFGPLFAALSTIAVPRERRAAAASLQRLLVETADTHARALAERLDEERETPAGRALLDRVVGAQHWRPASWKVAAEEINYRRFFDINALAALRMETASCFADAHAFVFELFAQGKIDGLRLDHVDGLFDPIGYCQLLCRRSEMLREPMYLVVEKILAPGQELLERWSVDGTTGYEFMNAVCGIFVDAANERAFDRLYRGFTGDDTPFREVAYRAKRHVLETALSAELNVLALRLDRIAQGDPHTRDFTLGALRRALIETVAVFPIYRTYVTAGELNASDRHFIERAIREARERDASSEGSIYDFLRRVLLTEHDEDAVRMRYVDFAMRFQQLTAPVTAKGVEDTAFYRSLRLVALNEVGGDPARFGTSVEEFHRQNARRAEHHPHAMLATSTHDDKRGEDVRMRLAVLSEIPEEWRRRIARWSRLNKRHRGPVSSLAEYLLYQTIVGAWPEELVAGELDPAALAAFRARVAAFLLKAAREAKLRTSWMNPDAEYETALERFVNATLDGASAPAFLRDAAEFARTIAAGALTNVLAQVVLKTTAPGVGDTYRGAEMWDITLVDPDNRRPVDFALRRAALDEIDARLADGMAPEELAAELLEQWDDGRIKLYVLATLLRHRAAVPWPPGAYEPLAVQGERASHVIAYARGGAVVAVPRLTYRLAGGRPPLGAVWGDAVLTLPAAAAPRYRDVLTGRTLESVDRQGRRVLPLAELFSVLPVAVLQPAG